MLLSFSVSNFRSIKETQNLSMIGTSLKGPHNPIVAEFPGGSYGVLPCAIVYGANASGKSNLIDAFMRMVSLVNSSQPDARKEEVIDRDPFLLDKEFSDKPTTFDVSFIKDNIRYDYGFSFVSEGYKEEWLYSYPQGRQRRIFEREDNKINFGPEMKKISEFFNDIFPWNSIVVGSYQFTQKFLTDQVDPRAIKFLSLLDTGVCDYQIETENVPEDRKKMIEDLIGVISNHSDDSSDLNDIQVDDKESRVKLGHRSLSEDTIFFEGRMESAGTRRLLILMNSLFKLIDEGDVAIIDEIDASLHTLAVEAIIQLFLNPRINKKGAQIIATTHDTNILNQEKLRRDEIWFAEKNIDGSSEYFSLSEIKSRKGEAFERAYLQGRYGGKPPSIPIELFIDGE